MEVDIDAVPEGEDASIEIEFLNRIPSWVNFKVGFTSKQKLLRYLVAMYSYDSFLNTRPPTPLEERKQKALAFAGIKASADVNSGLVAVGNDIVLAMIQDYLIAQRNTLWTEIATTEQQYEEAVRLRLKPMDDSVTTSELNKKDALRKNCKEMQTDLENFYKKFYIDHNDVRDAVRRKATTLESLALSAKVI